MIGSGSGTLVKSTTENPFVGVTSDPTATSVFKSNSAVAPQAYLWKNLGDCAPVHAHGCVQVLHLEEELGHDHDRRAEADEELRHDSANVLLQGHAQGAARPQALDYEEPLERDRQI